MKNGRKFAREIHGGGIGFGGAGEREDDFLNNTLGILNAFTKFRDAEIGRSYFIERRNHAVQDVITAFVFVCPFKGDEVKRGFDDAEQFLIAGRIGAD